jgi:hypothetical protein
MIHLKSICFEQLRAVIDTPHWRKYPAPEAMKVMSAGEMTRDRERKGEEGERYRFEALFGGLRHSGSFLYHTK